MPTLCTGELRRCLRELSGAEIWGQMGGWAVFTAGRVGALWRCPRSSDPSHCCGTAWPGCGSGPSRVLGRRGEQCPLSSHRCPCELSDQHAWPHNRKKVHFLSNARVLAEMRMVQGTARVCLSFQETLLSLLPRQAVRQGGPEAAVRRA